MSKLMDEEAERIRELLKDESKADLLWLTVLFMIFNPEDTAKIIAQFDEENEP